MSVKSTCSKSMGELLLKGWAMLAQNCPRCQVPLMRNPKTLSRLCVNCDQEYPAGQPLEEPDEFEEAALEQEEEEQAEPATMSASTAEAAPTHQQHATATMTSAGDGDAAPWRKKQGQSDKAAELLSDKMLQGWALLETCCPRCSTPLVRNKAKAMMCVMCQVRVVTEAEAAATSKATAAASGAGPGPGPDAATAATPQAGVSLPPGMAAPGASGSSGAEATAGDQGGLAAPPLPQALAVGRPAVASVLLEHAGNILMGIPSPTIAVGSPVLHGPSHLHPLQRQQQAQQQAGPQRPAGPLAEGSAVASGSPAIALPAAVTHAATNGAQLLPLLATTIEQKLWQLQELLSATHADDTAAIKRYTGAVCDCLAALGKIREEAMHVGRGCQ